MSKLLSRLGRVLGRIFRPLSRLRSTSRMILGVLSALGIGAVGLNWGAVKSWLVADWSHAALAALAVLFLGAFLALYGMEAELDALRVVRARVVAAEAKLWPVLNMERGAQLHNVLILRVEISLRNESERVTRAFFPKFRIESKEGRRWGEMKLEPVRGELNAAMHPRGLPSHSLWFPDERFEVEAKDEIIGRFSMMATSSEGAAAFLNRQLRVRVTVDVIGQPESILEVLIPPVALV